MVKPCELFLVSCLVFWTINYKKIKWVTGSSVKCLLIPALAKQSQAKLSEFEASLLYGVSGHPAIHTETQVLRGEKQKKRKKSEKELFLLVLRSFLHASLLIGFCIPLRFCLGINQWEEDARSCLSV